METEDNGSLLTAQIISIAEELSNFKQAEENQSENANLALQNLRDNRALDRPHKIDTEQESKIVLAVSKKDQKVQNSLLMQACQDNTMTHHQQISLYNLTSKNCRTTTLLIYNPEIETKEEKMIQTPETLDWGTCITQLPNGKLFCYANYSYSGITLIIDEGGGVQVLPSGTLCFGSSAIYFNNNVYCFGGYHGEYLTLSSRFDLDRNEWVELAPLPEADLLCNSIIFNGSILISRVINKNLLRYSIGSNSFTTIPYQFAEDLRKILINGDRLYLIECQNGWIYESEVWSDTDWRRIANSTINFSPTQTYCSYNKGEAYIGCIIRDEFYYYRFNFSNKTLMKLP